MSSTGIFARLTVPALLPLTSTRTRLVRGSLMASVVSPLISIMPVRAPLYLWMCPTPEKAMRSPASFAVELLISSAVMIWTDEETSFLGSSTLVAVTTTSSIFDTCLPSALSVDASSAGAPGA